MTDDEKDMARWKNEQSALTMAEIARDIWKDSEKEKSWRQSAENHRKARWPKDRPYQPIY